MGFWSGFQWMRAVAFLKLILLLWPFIVGTLILNDQWYGFLAHYGLLVWCVFAVGIQLANSAQFVIVTKRTPTDYQQGRVIMLAIASVFSALTSTVVAMRLFIDLQKCSTGAAPDVILVHVCDAEFTWALALAITAASITMLDVVYLMLYSTSGGNVN